MSDELHDLKREVLDKFKGVFTFDRASHPVMDKHRPRIALHPNPPALHFGPDYGQHICSECYGVGYWLDREDKGTKQNPVLTV